MPKKLVIASTEPVHTLAALSISLEELSLDPKDVFLIAFTYGQSYVTEGIAVMLDVVGIKADDEANYRLSSAETKNPGQLPFLSSILFPAIAASYAAENDIPIVVSDSSGKSYPRKAVQAMFDAQEQSTNGLLQLFGQEPLDVRMPLMQKSLPDITIIAYEYLVSRFVAKGLDEVSAQEEVGRIFEGIQG